MKGAETLSPPASPALQESVLANKGGLSLMRTFAVVCTLAILHTIFIQGSLKQFTSDVAATKRTLRSTDFANSIGNVSPGIAKNQTPRAAQPEDAFANNSDDLSLGIATNQTPTVAQTDTTLEANLTETPLQVQQPPNSAAIGQHEEALLQTRAAMELIQQIKDLKAREVAVTAERFKTHQHREVGVQKRQRIANTKSAVQVAREIDQDYASGCVMVMDANHELIEWLAYHYHTVPLRRLIILNDAQSKTSPGAILQRWKGLIDITLWNETDIWPDGAPKTRKGSSKDNYIKRQFNFNKHCMTKLYQEGHRWLIIHDPDEYMTINDRVYNKRDRMYGLNVSSEKIEIPSPREAGSMLKFVKSFLDYIQKYGLQGNKFLEPFETPCIPFHRKQFGNYGGQEEQLNEKNPVFPFERRDGLSPGDFSTWGWRRWGGRDSRIIGKALVDFDRVRKDEIPNEANVHIPIPKTTICRYDYAWLLENENPLVMNHYASSMEQSLFRSSDSRGGKEGRIERFKMDHKFRKFYDENPHILKWLPGFVESVGKTEAARLLQHAGNPHTAAIGTYMNLRPRESVDNHNMNDDNKEKEPNQDAEWHKGDSNLTIPKLQEEVKHESPRLAMIANTSIATEHLQEALLWATTELSQKIKELMAQHAQDLTVQETAFQEEQKRLDAEQKELLALEKNEKLSSQQAKHTVQQKAREQESVSGCVMVMDGNHELIEWLAYHYYTLPLRRLIIFNDKNSKTTPDPIVQRWKGLINITVWNETNIWPRGMPKTGLGGKYLYIWRQKEFNNRCMTTLYEEGQRWVQLFDPDEYMTINDRVYQKGDPMHGLNVPAQEIRIPSPKEAGSTLKFVKAVLAYVHKYGTQKNVFLLPFETPCIAFHRKQFGNWEDTNSTKEEKGRRDDYPFPFGRKQGILPSDLSTWRWRYWGGGERLMGKALIDFHRLHKEDIPEGASVHVPIDRWDICRRELAWGKEKEMPLMMNHYPSTWEQILFRTADNRGGNQSRIERYNNDQAYRKFYMKNPRILAWLPGFVESVGKTEALRLLQNAGNPQTANIGAFVEGQ